MRIAILSGGSAVAMIDNDVPEALHYYNDKLHQYLKGSASTFEFTCLTKHSDAQYLIAGNYISFVYEDKQYYMYISSTSQTETEVSVTAYSGTLELNYTLASNYVAGRSNPNLEECLRGLINPMGLGKRVNLDIGTMAVTTRKDDTWMQSQEETILAKMFTAAEEYGAELEFVTELNNDYTLKRLVVNAYASGNIGTKREDVYLRYGTNVTGIKRELDATEMFTSIIPVGKDDLSIAKSQRREVYNEDGQIAYVCEANSRKIDAVLAHEQFVSSVSTDGYITKRWSYDTSNKDILYAQALAYLKRRSVPYATYDVTANLDGLSPKIGDTFTIINEDFEPALYLSARLTEFEVSTTDPSSNKAVFSNVDTYRVGRTAEETESTYTVSVTSSMGQYRYKGSYNTILTATVKRGSRTLTASEVASYGFCVKWYLNNERITEGVSADGMTLTLNYPVARSITNETFVARLEES